MGKMITKAKQIDGSLWYYRADADEPEEKHIKTFLNVELYNYLSSIPMDFKMRLDDLNNYVGYVIYKGVSSKDGHGIYYYITNQTGCAVCRYYYLIAKLIEVKDGEFIIKQSPTIPVSQTGTYNISAVPFDTRYPCRWE